MFGEEGFLTVAFAEAEDEPRVWGPENGPSGSWSDVAAPGGGWTEVVLDDSSPWTHT